MRTMATLFAALVVTLASHAAAPSLENGAAPSPGEDCDAVSRQCTMFCTSSADPLKCYDDCMRFHGC